MVFGIVKNEQDMVGLAVMKSKNVERSNTFPLSFSSVLGAKISEGDTIWINSVEIFESVGQFVAFVKAVTNRNVAVRIVAQPYLDIGNGRYWKNSICRYISSLMIMEENRMMYLASVLKLNNAGRGYVAATITSLTVQMLSVTFSKDGILSRKNN